MKTNCSDLEITLLDPLKFINHRLVIKDDVFQETTV